MILFTVLVAFFVLGSCKEEADYKKECYIRGPQFWCKDEITAKQCQATAYCAEHVWPKQQTKSNGICEDCEQLVGTLHKLLADKSTQAEILGGIKAACSILPTTYQALCQEAVTLYGQQAINVLVQYTANTKQLCTMIGLCSSKKSHASTLKLNVLKAVVYKKSNDLCTTCQKYVGTVHLLIANNETQAEILVGMKALCSVLPTAYQPACQEVVTLYGQQIINMLVQYTANPKQFCSLIGLCNSTTLNIERFQMIKKLIGVKTNTDYCLTCQQYLGTLHMLIANNATQAEILNALKSACSLAPSTFATECNALVTLYGPTLIKWLVSYTADPSKFCTMIGLCKGHSSIPIVGQRPASGVLQFHREYPKLQDLEKEMFKEVEKKSQPSNTVTCEVCTVAMGYLDDILKDQTTEAAVKKGLDELCAYLPPSLKSECTSLVDQYADEIIKLIVSKVANPAQVCKELGLCTSQKKAIPVVKTPTNNAVTCEVCTVAMGYLEGILKGKRTEAAVKEGLDKLCGYLPTYLQVDCSNLVSQYTDEIINLLVNELADPAIVCKEIKLCSASKGVVKSQPGNPITCEVCTVAMGYLENLLKGNQTEAAVKAALDKVCSLLPSEVQSECTTLVNEYADEIVRIIVAELGDPKTVCTEIGLCSSKKRKIAKQSVAGSVTCEFCTFAMGELSSLLKDKSTEAEIKQALDSLCGRLPQYLSGECKTLVDEYADVIITVLAQEMDPSVVCKTIGLCKAEKGKANRKYMLAMRLSLKGVSCEACEFAMGYLDGLLTKNSTEAEIETVVEKLCGELPQAFKNECDALITEYGNELIKLIVQQIQPDRVCKLLKLC
ncbi:prosaposin-like isoform X4 [Hydractinia symbiolongicarpus]|uniref:prosaposin-like isoform X4 n=1 Tax=Hydractinia symbiolongicarpus TaxID=13093 RepID=UPI002549EA32|nr:prosaposin-like isoform X4 [Hydractinia symbiolongicarpus]